MEGLLSHLAALFITVIAIFALIPISHRIGLLDTPDHRKHHHGATPLIGGAAMYIGLACTLPVILPAYELVAPLMVALSLILFIGVLDDLRDLSARLRFSFQIAAALIMSIWGGVVIASFDETFINHPIELGFFAIPFTVFAVVGAINAINMSDGIDGLAGSLSITILASLGFVAYAGSSMSDFMVICAVIAVVIAFLIFNFPLPGRKHALIFMGDGGSMMLGLIIAWFAISLSQGDGAVISPVTVLWILGIPVIDTVAVMTRRILRGRSPFAADRGHFHHILLVAGYSRGKAVTTIALFNLLLGMIGVASDMYGVPEYIMFYLYMTLLGCYFWAMMYAWRVMQVVKRISS